MFALNVGENGRILSATLDKYAPASQPRVDTLPEGDVTDYLLIDGGYVYAPLPIPPEEPEEERTQEERIAALEDQLAACEAAFAEGVNEGWA